MSIHLVYITFNRLAYTRRSLPRLLEDPTEEFQLTIWDNGSTDGTQDYLTREIDDPRIADVVLSEANVGQVEAVNRVWGESKAELVGKADNDCLVTPGWTRTLARAHRDIDLLGVVACWHFFPEDFDCARARHKIERFAGHEIFRTPSTCGTGLLLKRRWFDQYGPLTGDATSRFWMRLARAGCINGFYYPLIYQEHMDDPRSQYSLSRTLPYEEAYRHSITYRRSEFRSAEEYQRVHQRILDELHDAPYDPSYYVGWRARLRRLWERVRGRGGR